MLGSRSTDRAALQVQAAQDLRSTLLAVSAPVDILTALRDGIGLRQLDVAVACGVTPRSARVWETGGPVRRRHEERLALLALVVAEMLRAVSPVGIERWLRRPNPHCGRISPLEALAAGQSDVVWAAVEAIVGDQDG